MTTLLPRDEIRARVERLLAASPADSTAISWLETRRGSAIAGARERRAEEAATRIVVLRVREGGRCGSIATAAAEPGALEDALRQALVAAKAARPTPAAAEPADDSSMPGEEGALEGEGLDLLTPSSALDALDRWGERQGSLRFDWGSLTIVAGRSGRRVRATTLPFATLVARSGRRPGSGFAAASARSLGALAPDEVVARARALEAGADPQIEPPASSPLVLGPEAAAALVEALARVGFSARPVLEGSPLVAERLPPLVLPAAFDLLDDPASSVLPLPFDFDGVSKGRMALVERGVPGRAAFDLDLGARLGRASTGHGLAGDDAWPLHPALAAGELDGDALLAAAADGLHIGCLEGLRVAAAPGLPFSALARSVRRIDGSGRLAGALAPLLWRGSLVETLGRVTGAGRARAAWDVAGRGLGAACAPALALAPAGVFAPAGLV